MRSTSLLIVLLWLVDDYNVLKSIRKPPHVDIKSVFSSTAKIPALIVLLALSGCATSQEQGPYGPAENMPSFSAGIAEINAELAKWELTFLDGVPVLVGPQR
jgi:uncharacterized protein YceK